MPSDTTGGTSGRPVTARAAVLREVGLVAVAGVVVVVVGLVSASRYDGIGADDVAWTLDFAGVTAAAMTASWAPVRRGRPIAPAAMAALVLGLAAGLLVWVALVEVVVLGGGAQAAAEAALLYLAPGLVVSSLAAVPWWWARRRQPRTATR